MKTQEPQTQQKLWKRKLSNNYENAQYAEGVGLIKLLPLPLIS